MYKKYNIHVHGNITPFTNSVHLLNPRDIVQKCSVYYYLKV